MKVLITGAAGFIGRNLASRLRVIERCDLYLFDIANSDQELQKWLSECDIVYHLAGVNRPETVGEFESGNCGFTGDMCNRLHALGRAPKIVMASSVQASLPNPYGVSKLRAEEALRDFAAGAGASLQIYRLKNVFGKWCRPNYNSVVATFCFNTANDLPLRISDPANEVDLVYIDDVVDTLLRELPGPEAAGSAPQAAEIPSYKLTLGDLAGRLQAFHEMRSTLRTPDFSVPFNRNLYATYLSYVPDHARLAQLRVNSDDRGSLAELIKSTHFGQLFVSRTRPGITRGNHYHHTKTEKFFVVEGEGIIRMRRVGDSDVSEYRVRGSAFQVVDIPPGYTHSIENVGAEDMITLFWADEVFDPDRPDTYFLPVLQPSTGTGGVAQ